MTDPTLPREVVEAIMTRPRFHRLSKAEQAIFRNALVRVDPEPVAFYVPMPLDSNGHGPACRAETVSVEHQVWDAVTNSTLCVAADEATARHIVSRLNANAPTQEPAPLSNP